MAHILNAGWQRAAIALGVFTFAACQPIRLMPGAMHQVVEAQYHKQYYALRQSVYFGPFYDAPRLTLMDAHPFDSLSYVMTPWGAPFTPGLARGILPAGTRVRIESVEMPTLGLIAGRPTLSPRFNPWVKLRVNRFDVTEPQWSDGMHVVVLPIGISDLDTLTSTMGQLFGDTQTVKNWLAQRSPEVQQAIARKELHFGMTFEEAVAALGNPDDVRREDLPQGRKDTATWGARAVVFMDDIATDAPVTPTAPAPGTASPAPATPAPAAAPSADKPGNAQDGESDADADAAPADVPAEGKTRDATTGSRRQAVKTRCDGSGHSSSGEETCP